MEAIAEFTQAIELTQANKSSYIDTFLDRNLNALQLSTGVGQALSNEE